MRRGWLGLLLASGLAGAVPVAGLSDPGPGDLEHNRQWLEKWRADPKHYRRLMEDPRAFWWPPAETRERLRRPDQGRHSGDAGPQKRRRRGAAPPPFVSPSAAEGLKRASGRAKEAKAG